MQFLRPRRWIRVLSLGAVAAASGCAAEQQVATALLADESEIVFLAQSVRPDVVMEALFDGDVSVDGAGCFRLAMPEAPTVVWPYGYTAEVRDSRVVVRDDAGRERGRVAGHFRFGGGIVPTLHEGIPLTASDRAAALERCPGSFWIVGEML